jgi:hypothetical protein
VGPQYSTFALPEDTTTEEETFVLPDGKILDVNDHTLYAVFSQIPAPKEMVRISGRDRAGIKALKDAWTEKAKALNIHFLEAGDDTPFTLRVKSDNGAYVLRDLELKQDTPVNYTTDKPEEVVADLITITKWRRTRALHKDRSRLKGKIQLDLRVTGADDQAVALRENNGRLILRASESTMMPLTKPGWRVYEVHPEVSISGVDTDLHCYLLELYENNYKVKMYSVPKPFQHLHSSGTITYESKKIGLSADSDNFTYHFKLLVTTSPLDYFQLLQEGIPGDRFEAEQTEDPNQGFEDWWVIDKVLKVVRRD